MSFTNTLIKWYLSHKRDLPWRNTSDPYKIWLSEIILQQTRVTQGMPYYLRFVEAFPAVADLAAADEQRILKLWQGLGYYSRARNLHQTAQYIVSELDGKFPDNYAGLIKLKGIGDYTAAAIASFAYGEVVPVVDGNVFRVLSRYFGIDSDIGTPLARRQFKSVAAELISKTNPAIFNQAIMEFGALQCVPKNPDCGICPLNDSCLALMHGKVGILPVKLKKAKPVVRHMNFIVGVDDDGHSVIRKRPATGIWRHLYEFPVIETNLVSEPETIQTLVETDVFPHNEMVSFEEYPYSASLHKLTHQHLYVRFWRARVGGKLDLAKSPDSIAEFPFPIVIFNFLERVGNRF